MKLAAIHDSFGAHMRSYPIICYWHFGRKPALIRRLVSVYKAELDTMTVKQLRRILKSKGIKQGGLKSELVQKLVEAGCM